MPFAELLGVEVLAASPEEVRARIAWEERLCTAGGILHGGALMSLADAAGAFCTFLNLPERSAGTATIESKTNFFRAVRGGFLALAYTLAERLEAGKRVARVTQTQAVLGA